ncbi:protein C3orf33-like [Panulirus ornatus]|uniref:protein C3orf33-like n=1 Tax=Panulirus ornatus TaxID=150431 RepID=UPI003A8A8FD1
MSDDAPQPPSSFYTSASSSFAKITHAIDDNIRIIQYGIYCAGVAGAILVLHSVRAFTKFTSIHDIPKEFITKHVRLHGRVKWVGVTPPGTEPTTATVALPLPAKEDTPQAATHMSPLPTENGSISPPFSPTGVETKENVVMSGPGAKSLSEDNRGIYEGAGELHPWEDGIDPNVARIQYDEELRPLYLQVEHTPVIPLLQKKSDQLLPIQLADVELTGAGVWRARGQLEGQRTWFTLISHNTDHHTLVSLVRPAKMFRRMSLNEQLLREGLAIVGPMDLELHEDRYYVKLYTKLLRAQEYAEKRELGMWKVPSKLQRGLLGRLWVKLRALVARKSH